MVSQGSRAPRVWEDPLGFLDPQGCLAAGGHLGRKGRQGLVGPQEFLVCGVTRVLVAWLGSLVFQVRGGFLGPMGLLDQLGPRVSRGSLAAQVAQGQREPWDRRESWGSPGSLACGAPRESQGSRAQQGLLDPKACQVSRVSLACRDPRERAKLGNPAQ